MSDHSLTLGSLLLTDSAADADYGFTFSVLADGMSTGSGAAVKEIVTSLLADGDLVRTTRYGNREVSFAVQIEGPTLGSLAQGEAALRREVGRGNTLTWQAPDVLSVPTVFDVVDSEMAQTFDDLDELRRRRTFVVSLTCSPFARSESMTTVDALSVPAVETRANIDTCDSATGWTGTFNGSPTTVSTTWAPGAVSMLDVLIPGPQTLTLTRTGTVDFTPTRYLEAEIGYDPNLGMLPVVCSSPAGTFSLLSQRLISPGLYLYVYDSGGVDATELTFSSYSAADFADLKIFNLARTDSPPSLTPRQIDRILEVGGTERTPCSMKVVPGAAEALGLALVHTSPEAGIGYSPALRRWRVSGNTETTEVGSLSGEKEAITATPIVAQVPLTSLPEDGYALMAYMRSTVVGTFPLTWQARTIVDSVYYGGHEGVANAYFPVADEWTLVPLAVVTLPPVRAAIGGVVQFNITRTVVDEEIYLDEWWAFRLGDDCALTIVKSDEASFLWLDSPDSSSPVPRVWVSNNSDRSDQRHPGPGLIAQGNHVLTPGGTMVFVASSGIEYPALSATYHKRWHSNAAE